MARQNNMGPGDTVTLNRRTTRYMNPTDGPQKLKFLVEECKYIRDSVGEVKHVIPPTYEEFEIPPGAEASIPSVYDRAIHNVQGGMILGGMAPLLINLDRDLRIAPALIPSPEARPISLTSSELVDRLRGGDTPADDPDAGRVRRARTLRSA